MVLLSELAMGTPFTVELAVCFVHKVGFITLEYKFTDWDNPSLRIRMLLGQRGRCVFFEMRVGLHFILLFYIDYNL